MAWEQRRGRRVYYDAERVGGRVVKRYVGTGRVAELAALRAELHALAELVGPVHDLARAAAEAWMNAAGYYQHHRGEWRRRTAAKTDGKRVEAVATPGGWDRPAGEVNALVAKAQAGDRAALAEFKGMLAADPGGPTGWSGGTRPGRPSTRSSTGSPGTTR